MTWDSECWMGNWKMKQLLAKFSVRGNKGLSGEGCKCSFSYWCSGCFVTCEQDAEREEQWPGGEETRSLSLSRHWQLRSFRQVMENSLCFPCQAWQQLLRCFLWNVEDQMKWNTWKQFGNWRVVCQYQGFLFFLNPAILLSKNRKMLAQDNFHSLEGGE